MASPAPCLAQQGGERPGPSPEPSGQGSGLARRGWRCCQQHFLGPRYSAGPAGLAPQEQGGQGRLCDRLREQGGEVGQGVGQAWPRVHAFGETHKHTGAQHRCPGHSQGFRHSSVGTCGGHSGGQKPPASYAHGWMHMGQCQSAPWSSCPACLARHGPALPASFELNRPAGIPGPQRELLSSSCREGLAAADDTASTWPGPQPAPLGGGTRTCSLATPTHGPPQATCRSGLGTTSLGRSSRGCCWLSSYGWGCVGPGPGCPCRCPKSHSCG